MSNSVKELKDIISKVPIKRVQLSENESLNDIFQKHGSVGVMNVIQNAQAELEEVEPIAQINVAVPISNTIFPENENWVNKANEFLKDNETTEINSNEVNADSSQADGVCKLEVIHENKLRFKTEFNHYYVLGSLTQDLSAMRITLLIEDLYYGRKERVKIDLYERDFLRSYTNQLAELFHQNPEVVEAEFLQLTDLLEQYRESQYQQSKEKFKPTRQYAVVSPDTQITCKEFLMQADLINSFDKLIEKAGLVGEERTRKLIFVIASTYKMSDPLHALVQGSSGSGKSHIINVIGQCLPPEDVMSMTRVTSKSFYHYNKDELVDKLMLIQDFDGLDEEAQYAFRELQSAGNISSSTTYKDRSGNIISTVKVVRSHFASLLATTKAEIYYDNMGRSIVIGVDESDEQTNKIIAYQNKRLAGLIDKREEQKAKEFLQNCIRCIKPLEVINHYADKIFLPLEAKMLRRLNSHYQAFVKQITLLHQYQRKKDEQGRLIAEPEDLKMACDILFDAIMLKVDDLDSSLRQFFDRMKIIVNELSKQTGKPKDETVFTQREIRLALNASKSQCFRYMEDLELLEYVQKTGGYANRGFKYKIIFWDDMNTMREKIKQGLNEQLEKLNVLVLGGSNEMNHHNATQQGDAA
jgi:energy-coupling factor transporter ATP-binding protein EcfA2